jgi:hypothetical protein
MARRCCRATSPRGEITDPESGLSLLAMAQSWLKLAEQAVKNSETVLVYETPVPKETP